MELTANELRIGNLVNYQGKIIKVEGIHNRTIYHSDRQFDQVGVDGYKTFEPIPLTEEFLLENGFKEKRYEYTIPISDCGLVTLTLIPHDEFPTDCSVCVSQEDGHNEDEIENVFLSEIKYVHQLQNLYISLTNNELKLK